MESKSYTTTIEVAKSPSDVFNHVIDVSKWWNKEDFEGDSTTLNDEFIIHHVGRHYSKQKLAEVISDEKIVWLVTESELNWIEKDTHEWTDTKLVFEITAYDDKTVLRFTHEGLVPEMECYAQVEESWKSRHQGVVVQIHHGRQSHIRRPGTQGGCAPWRNAFSFSGAEGVVGKTELGGKLAAGVELEGADPTGLPRPTDPTATASGDFGTR